MLIKFKSKRDSVATALRLSTTYNKKIGARIKVIAEDGSGVDIINANPGMAFNINITPYQLSDIVHTTKIVYDLFTPKKVKVTNSGTPTPLLSAGCYANLQKTKGQTAADNFYAKWKPDLQFNTLFAPKVEAEWNMYRNLHMPKLVNSFHWALKLTNIDCFREVLDYIYTYSAGHEVINNELTVYDSQAPLLKRCLTYMQDRGIKHVVGYDDKDPTDGNLSNPYTPAMEAVLCGFAEE
jgi:hypothetical protein